MKPQPLSPSVVELPGEFTHEFIHTRGIRLHAATAGNPNDPLVVAIHGSFGGWFDYREVISAIAEQGYHVAAVDLRGFGMSDKPPTDLGQDIRVLTGDIAGLIQALGHESAALIGNDTGATLAWAVAVEKPELVSGLISISGAFSTDLRRAVIRRPWDFFWILLRLALFRLPLAFWQRQPGLWEKIYRKELRLDTASHYRGEAYEHTLELRLKAVRISKVIRGTMWNHRLLTGVVPRSWLDTRLSAPVLFLHADQGLWRPIIRRARKRASAGFEATSIHGAKNLPMLENPAAFVHVISSWLQEIRH